MNAMTHRPPIPDFNWWWAAVVPISGKQGHIIGTGVTIAPERVLTALHVTDPEPRKALRVGAGLAVSGTATLPWRRYGRRQRQQARDSYERGRDLTDRDEGTVDLVLLAVPELRTPALAIRQGPVHNGEQVGIAGYPAGRWTVTVGPITSHDESDFVAHVLLGSGSSGSPAVDADHHLTGLLTMDHATAGAILIGPQLLTEFVRRALPLLARR